MMHSIFLAACTAFGCEPLHGAISKIGFVIMPPLGLEYTYFMKIGQPKLSERISQRSGLLVPPTIKGRRICELVITKGNKEKRQSPMTLPLPLSIRMRFKTGKNL